MNEAAEPRRATPPRPRRLYHYCCDHSLEGILATGMLRPHPGGLQHLVKAITGVTVVALPVVWLTDIDVRRDEDVEVLGLHSVTGLITCDRVQYRFRVSPAEGAWWPEWADEEVAAGRLPVKQRLSLELDREPERWWVSPRPIPGVRLDERYRRP